MRPVFSAPPGPAPSSTKQPGQPRASSSISAREVGEPISSSPVTSRQTPARRTAAVGQRRPARGSPAPGRPSCRPCPARGSPRPRSTTDGRRSDPIGQTVSWWASSSTRFGPVPNRQRRWLQPSTTNRSGLGAQPRGAERGDQRRRCAAPRPGRPTGTRSAPAAPGRPADSGSRGLSRPRDARRRHQAPAPTPAPATPAQRPVGHERPHRGPVRGEVPALRGHPVVVEVGLGVPVARVAQQGDDRPAELRVPHLGDQLRRHAHTLVPVDGPTRRPRIGFELAHRADRGGVRHPVHPVDDRPDERRLDPRPADALDPRPGAGARRVGVPPGREERRTLRIGARTAGSGGRGSGRTGRWSRWSRPFRPRPRPIPAPGAAPARAGRRSTRRCCCCPASRWPARRR